MLPEAWRQSARSALGLENVFIWDVTWMTTPLEIAYFHFLHPAFDIDSVQFPLRKTGKKFEKKSSQWPCTLQSGAPSTVGNMLNVALPISCSWLCFCSCLVSSVLEDKQTCMQFVNMRQTAMSLEKILRSSGLVSMQSFRQLSRKLVWWQSTSSIFEACRGQRVSGKKKIKK